MKKVIINQQSKQADGKLLLLTIILTTLGVIAVADASAPAALNNFSDKYYFAKQQIVWGVIGLLSLFVFSKIKYVFWEKIATVFIIFNILSLVFVLIPGLGVKVSGARRWIIIGPVRYQPAEYVKLALSVYFAKLTAKNKKLLSYLIPLGLIVFLIMLEPDLGTTVMITAIGLAQVFVSGVSLWRFSQIVLVGLVSSILLIISSDYRRARLMTFLESTYDPLGKSYHIRQILLGLGVGGFLGVGLGQSKQKYLFLPEAATDSIFAVIAEEIGFLGASVLIVLFMIFIFRGLRIARNAPDTFSQSLAVALVVWIGGQAFVNIASMVALVPLTGIPLPFFSYGGSSLVAVLTATGILLNISRYEKKTARSKRK